MLEDTKEQYDRSQVEQHHSHNSNRVLRIEAI